MKRFVIHYCKVTLFYQLVGYIMWAFEVMSALVERSWELGDHGDEFIGRITWMTDCIWGGSLYV